MTELSFSVNLAWQLAAQEAAAARYGFIEPQHILMGICSLEKVWLIGNRRDSAIYGGGWQRGDNLLNRERGAGKGVRCWIIRSSGVSGL